MSIIKDLLEADINLPKDDFSVEKDDPNVQLSFEHALHTDLQKVVETLSGINNKLNNKKLFDEMKKLYEPTKTMSGDKVNDLNLYFSINVNNPIHTIYTEIETAIMSIKQLMQDIQTLSKI